MRGTTRTAVEWWAREISEGGSHDNGSADPFLLGAVALLSDASAVSTKATEAFKADLADYLDSQSVTEPTFLRSDYGPEDPLAEFADKYGIPSIRFPWKTSMLIHFDEEGNGHVEVKVGYGAEFAELPVVPIS